MNTSIFAKPTALAPLGMSLAALILVLGHILFFGAVRQADEGAVAHIFQLLIAAQVPIVLFFAFRWLRRTPKQALGVLALQAAAVATACAPVWYFNL